MQFVGAGVGEAVIVELVANAEADVGVVVAFGEAVIVDNSLIRDWYDCIRAISSVRAGFLDEYMR